MEIFTSPPNQVVVSLRLELGEEVDGDEIVRGVRAMVENFE